MTTTVDTHLTYDDLLRTLVDRDELDVETRDHLGACPRCQQQAERLGQRYHKMGQMAKVLAPSPSRPFRVPDQRTASSRWQFKSAVGLGLAGALVFFLTVWWPQYMAPTESTRELAQAMEADDRLMAQIDALVEDALPEGYQELAMMSDADTIDLSEDLIDWIVPSIEGTIEEGEPIG